VRASARSSAEHRARCRAPRTARAGRSVRGSSARQSRSRSGSGRARVRGLGPSGVRDRRQVAFRSDAGSQVPWSFPDAVQGRPFRRCALGLGKDFRLPLDARPVRYAAHLAPDLDAGTFEGRLELEVRLGKPRRDLTLHALDLEVERARVRAGGKTVRVSRIEPDAESETVALCFDEEVPAGTAVVELTWRGKFSPGLRGLY